MNLLVSFLYLPMMVMVYIYQHLWVIALNSATIIISMLIVYILVHHFRA